ncbi:MAG: L-serine ammonia-lyase, iron-sulfur-dependent, subunit alpha, partial [Muribaculaceae bacterium]|nr:L-serine ammonia-lyase, iron-sulfur-dependent, subunit alpha [Muribaculaceae bacterium]
MESIRKIFKIGHGPSSSHTMGPRKAAQQFRDNTPGTARYRVTLYGSLAATGAGHLTDQAILEELSQAAETDIIWKPQVFLPFHPNAMLFEAIDSKGDVKTSDTIYSIGGGDIMHEGEARGESDEQVYAMSTISEILAWCEETGRNFWEYVDICEGPAIWDYLREVWKVMKEAVERGIEAEGVLPGGLGLRRKAVSYYMHATGYNPSLKSRGLVYAYALAVSEENASGGLIVTAPTCGSCGIVPAVLYHLSTSKGFSEQRILRALATAGLFGSVVKHNASVSGAEVGCQGEVGVACAMAAAAASQLFGGTPAQIEYSAEMGLEHHLGLTCDPVCGLVQVPC